MILPRQEPELPDASPDSQGVEESAQRAGRTDTFVMGRHRFRFLDLLRLVAALMVLGYHYFARAPAEVWGVRSGEIPERVFQLTAYGALGVDLFFIISGFVIALSLGSRSIEHFVASRVARLFPAYLVAVALMLLLPQQVRDFHPSAVPEYLINFSMLQIPLGIEPLSGVYWTLWVEATFYILMGVVAGRRGLTYKKLAAVVFFWPLAGLYAQTLGLESVGNLLQRNSAPLFAGGICIYMLYRYGGSLLTWSALLVNVGLSTWTVTSGGFLAAMEATTGRDLSVTVTAALTVTFFAAVFLASCSRLRARGHRVLTAAGALTYPLYLIHQEWGWYLIDLSPRTLPPAATTAGVCTVVIAAAYLIHRFVERPAGPRVRRAIRASFDQARAPEAGSSD